MGEKGNVKDKSANWWFHVVFWLFAITVFNLYYPYSRSSVEWSYAVHSIYLQWLIYILLSGWELKNELRILFKKGVKFEENQIWKVSIFFGVTIIWVAYVFGSYASYIVGALSFSFVFYILGLFWFFKRTKLKQEETQRQEIKRTESLRDENENLEVTPVKYANKKIEEEEAQELKTKIETLMVEKELFKKPNLKLPELAEKLNILPHHLSQFLNDNLGKSFPLFINEYRIEAAKKLLLQNNNYTLEAIGYECGFNSKSTFFSTFKKITHSTPASYKRKYQKL